MRLKDSTHSIEPDIIIHSIIEASFEMTMLLLDSVEAWDPNKTVSVLTFLAWNENFDVFTAFRDRIVRIGVSMELRTLILKLLDAMDVQEDLIQCFMPLISSDCISDEMQESVTIIF